MLTVKYGMGYRRIILGIGLLSAMGAANICGQTGGAFSVATLSTQQGFRFEPKEVVFIQQYYSNAPKYYLDDVLKKEKALPPGPVALIAQGKRLPKELVPLALEAPTPVTRYLGPPARGLERKVLGARFLLLDSRQIVQDMVHLPTVAAPENRK